MRYIFLFVTLFFITGCSQARLQYDTPEQAFEEGKSFLEDEKYTQASDALRAAFDYGRAYPWAPEAQFLLATSYYQNKRYLQAVNEYERFIQLYRTDSRVEEAEFQRALCHFQLSPPYALDQSDTKRALSDFQIFISRYPNSPRRAEAGDMINELLEKLGKKQFESARLYERQDMYEAAAISYKRVLELYPSTTWVDQALLGAMRSYINYSNASIQQRQAERAQSALDIYTQMLQLFPNSNYLKEAETLYGEAQAILDVHQDQN